MYIYIYKVQNLSPKWSTSLVETKHQNIKLQAKRFQRFFLAFGFSWMGSQKWSIPNMIFFWNKKSPRFPTKKKPSFDEKKPKTPYKTDLNKSNDSTNLYRYLPHASTLVTPGASKLGFACHAGEPAPWNQPNPGMFWVAYPLGNDHISQLGERKIIFKSALGTGYVTLR